MQIQELEGLGVWSLEDEDEGHASTQAEVALLQNAVRTLAGEVFGQRQKFLREKQQWFREKQLHTGEAKPQDTMFRTSLSACLLPLLTLNPDLKMMQRMEMEMEMHAVHQDHYQK